MMTVSGMGKTGRTTIAFRGLSCFAEGGNLTDAKNRSSVLLWFTNIAWRPRPGAVKVAESLSDSGRRSAMLRAAAYSRQNVDIEQHFDVVGDKAHGSSTTSRIPAAAYWSRQDSTVGPSHWPPVNPWLWKAKSHCAMPALAATAAAVARHSASYGSPAASACAAESGR